MALGQGQRLVGRLRRDGDQRRAGGADVGQRGLEGRELQVAVRAPGAAVEDQHHGAVGEQVVERELAATRVRKPERRGAIAGAQRAREHVAGAHCLGVTVEDRQSLLADLAEQAGAHVGGRRGEGSGGGYGGHGEAGYERAAATTMRHNRRSIAVQLITV